MPEMRLYLERKKLMAEKPAYRIPSMLEILDLPWNGFNAISTFSGCGGSSLGYRMAGFRVLYANEFIEAARDSYNANKADYTYVDSRDIRQVKGDEILKIIKLEKGQLDLLDGSPPCASFSTAGKRHKGWGTIKAYSDTKQRTDDLFFEFARLISEIQPKVFIAENVSGLIKGSAKGYYLEILKVLKDCGYRVKSKLLDAQWLGVPQARQRLIFIGVRNDLLLDPAYPMPFSYQYMISDVLTYVKKIKVGGLAFDYRKANIVSPTIMQSDADRNESAWLSGGGWIEDEANKKRKFTIDELKLICAFPDDFILTGTYQQQWERLGRAVPPLMMKAIAETVRDKILCRL